MTYQSRKTQEIIENNIKQRHLMVCSNEYIGYPATYLSVQHKKNNGLSTDKPL